MRLILFRHADKKPALHDDPELTSTGLLKAQKLVDLVKEKKIPAPTMIWSSPKIRALQTFKPLAQHLQLNLVTSDLLLESQPIGPNHGFDSQYLTKRVGVFLEKLAPLESSTHFVCSHYDWVIEASKFMLQNSYNRYGSCHHWEPCQYVEFEYTPEQTQWIYKKSDIVQT